MQKSTGLEAINSDQDTNKDYLQTSFWLGLQLMKASKAEKVYEQRYKRVPASYKRKVTLPLVRTKTAKQKSLLRQSQDSLVYPRAMYSSYSLQSPKPDQTAKEDQNKDT